MTAAAVKTKVSLKAGKKTTILEQPLGEDDAATARLADDQEQSIAEFISEFGEQAKTIKLYRYGDDGQPAYCGTYAVGDFSEDVAARKWGNPAGGVTKFQARLRDESNRPLKTKIFRTVSPEPLTPAVAPREPDSEAPTLVRMLERQTDDFKALLTALITRERPDTDGSIVKTIAVLKELGVIGERHDAAGATGLPMEAVGKMVTEAIEVGKRLAGGAEPEDMATVAIREVAGPMIQKFLSTPSSPPAPAALPAPLPNGGANPPAPEAAPVAPTPKPSWQPPAGAPAWFLLVAPRLKQLYDLAQAGLNAKSVAGLIIDNLNDSAFDVLVADVERGEWTARTWALLPDAFHLEGMAAWTRAVLALVEGEVRAQLEPEGDQPVAGDVPPDTAAPVN